MPHRRSLSAIAALAAAVLVTGCGSHDEGASPETSPASSPSSSASFATASATASSPEATSSPTASSASPTASEASCTDLTGQQALEKWIGKVPQAFPGSNFAWTTKYADTQHYDPCADLSWVATTVDGATVSSPYAVLLFHHGEYVGPATEKPQGFGPRISRVDGRTLRITYTYTVGSEANAAASGRATSTFTWNDAAHRVDRTGDLPPTDDGSGSSPAATAASLPDGAYSGAGGSRPADAQPVTANVEGGTGIIVMPSGNIGCDFDADRVGCGVGSLNADPSKRGPTGFANWWFVLNGNGTPTSSPKGDPGNYDLNKDKAQTVGYGEVVYRGDNVCASEPNGLTCWNTTTGHGFFLSKARQETF